MEQEHSHAADNRGKQRDDYLPPLEYFELIRHLTPRMALKVI